MKLSVLRWKWGASLIRRCRIMPRAFVLSCYILLSPSVELPWLLLSDHGSAMLSSSLKYLTWKCLYCPNPAKPLASSLFTAMVREARWFSDDSRLIHTSSFQLYLAFHEDETHLRPVWTSWVSDVFGLATWLNHQVASFFSRFAPCFALPVPVEPAERFVKLSVGQLVEVPWGMGLGYIP